MVFLWLWRFMETNPRNTRFAVAHPGPADPADRGEGGKVLVIVWKTQKESHIVTFG